MSMVLKARCAVLLQHTNSASSRYCVPESGELDINIVRVTITVTERAALLKAPTLAVHPSLIYTHTFWYLHVEGLIQIIRAGF